MALSVREVMSTDVRTVGPEEAARRAWELMRDRRIRHLPVVDGGRLVGVLSDRDLRAVLLSPGLAGATVGELMSEPPVTVTPRTAVEDAASLLVVKKIGCLPVVDEERLVGIV